ncbi:hypothetical protein LTR33_017979, partial [Friedmanniomyces endolithicus]
LSIHSFSPLRLLTLASLRAKQTADYSGVLVQANNQDLTRRNKNRNKSTTALRLPVMGFGNYFKKGGKKEAQGTELVQDAHLDEKVPRPFASDGVASSRSSISPSVRSESRPSSLMNEIKHEVMVNYLFQ